MAFSAPQAGIGRSFVVWRTLDRSLRPPRAFASASRTIDAAEAIVGPESDRKHTSAIESGMRRSNDYARVTRSCRQVHEHDLRASPFEREATGDSW
jgi:hypothetical protein